MNSSKLLRGVFHQVRNMSTAISNIANVDIDQKGVFKYILIELTVSDDNGQKENKQIVRGYAECPYHSDIYDKVTSELQDYKSTKKICNWQMKVLGGGRIDHDSNGKNIKVYGYSQGYGKAEHQISVDILKKKYPDYNICWDDGGY